MIIHAVDVELFCHFDILHNGLLSRAIILNSVIDKSMFCALLIFKLTAKTY